MRGHVGMLVRGIVVCDQVQRFILGRFAVDSLQEFQPLVMAVALSALGDRCSVQYIERGK